MKKLKELIPCEYDIKIESIEDDSRVQKNDYLFCCIEGLTVDGHQYAGKAVENGAVAVLASKDVNVSVPVIKVQDTNKAMLKALSNFYDNVDEKLSLFGVTGTDGKTTVASIIYQIFNHLDKSGYIGTNGIICDEFKANVGYTTPFPGDLFKALADFKRYNCNYVSIEISSERLLTKRIDDLKLDVAIFTNITSDHLDKHKTWKNYLESKTKIFSMLKDKGTAVINADDPHVSFLKKNIKKKNKVLTYGIEKKADFMATDIVIAEHTLLFTLKSPEGDFFIKSPLSGKFNVYNLMAAFATCYALKLSLKDIVPLIEELKPIPGRIDIIDVSSKYKVMIDYAHTPNALKNLLQYAKIITKGNIITVVGAAGGRDGQKRFEMGEVVTSLSDYVIFTADDPRHEDPNNIIDEMVKGLSKVNFERVIDRPLAIKRALSIAQVDDMVVIAGRGDDIYMPVGDTYIRCNDKEEVFKYLASEKISLD
ncbi:MAG: UDP-N-acetylmuramoyl-L-alanyl-D-glutamate--2,6-diaminopimelate ligase [Bacilli bacterium]|jgi:UDP-N-acetylmuramoyl-L-alanyl-D-glutamate--2,6-diaminopimelate ligase